MSRDKTALPFARQPREQSKINLNRATYQELIRLPGIGEITARRIIDYRLHHGHFHHIEDLVFNVGLRQRWFDQIRDRLEV
jgi:competence protein ComEA